jgi:hypothetical protein
VVNHFLMQAYPAILRGSARQELYALPDISYLKHRIRLIVWWDLLLSDYF